MSTNLLAALTGLVALSVLIVLISAENKSWLWRKAMYAGTCGYTITAMLFWLNRYTVPDLHPIDCLAITDVIMMVPVAINYLFRLRGPVIVPADELARLSAMTDSAAVIEHYKQQLAETRSSKFRTGLVVGAGGLIVIGGWFLIVHAFGLAENVSGNQEDFSKVLVRLVGEVHTIGVKVDTVGQRVRVNGGRITALETRNRASDKRDSLFAVRSQQNQAKMLSNQSKALKVLKPKAVPQPVQPIRRKSIFDIFNKSSRIDRDSADYVGQYR